MDKRSDGNEGGAPPNKADESGVGRRPTRRLLPGRDQVFGHGSGRSRETWEGDRSWRPSDPEREDRAADTWGRWRRDVGEPAAPRSPWGGAGAAGPGEARGEPERGYYRGRQDEMYSHGGVGEADRPRTGRREERGWWQQEPLTVAEIMTANLKTLPEDAPLTDVADLMRREDIGVVPLVDTQGKLAAIVTDRDIVVRGLAGGQAFDSLRAKDIATGDVEAVSPEDRVVDVLDLMGRRQIRRVPVVDDADRLLGVVSLSDIASRADYHEELQSALERISGRRSFWSRIWR